MLNKRTRGEIASNPMWRDHLKTAMDFTFYLQSTAGSSFRITGEVDYEGYPLQVVREFPYAHRWHPLYKSAVLKKFYQYEEHLKGHPIPVLTMLTLTTFHSYDQNGRKSQISDATIPEAFAVLKNGWLKLSRQLRKMGLSYVWILEPHRTGYPHLHVAIPAAIPPHQKERIRKLWFRYGCGSLEHGTKFSEKAGADSVKSIRNYLMKYLIKSWRDSAWTTSQLVFNSLVWKHHWRMWGSTKDITAIMARVPEQNEIEWQKTEIFTEYTDNLQPVWVRPHSVFDVWSVPAGGDKT